MGDAAEGRVDEEICRRDLPSTVGRKPDSAKPTSRPRLSVSMLFRLGRAEACVGGLGAFARSALSVTLPHAPGLSRSLPADKYCIGVRLDWVIHKHGYRCPTRPTTVGRKPRRA
jgi:hypothetical protein